jgi:hypothetical protein
VNAACGTICHVLPGVESSSYEFKLFHFVPTHLARPTSSRCAIPESSTAPFNCIDRVDCEASTPVCQSPAVVPSPSAPSRFCSTHRRSATYAASNDRRRPAKQLSTQVCSLPLLIAIWKMRRLRSRRAPAVDSRWPMPRLQPAGFAPLVTSPVDVIVRWWVNA